MKRRSGVLLHIASLPSLYGIGDMGKAARQFADLLCAHNQTLWQVLPLVPVEVIRNRSPYSSTTAFAGNPLFVDLETLYNEGLLSRSDMTDTKPCMQGCIDYQTAFEVKSSLIDRAWKNFRRQRPPHEFESFCKHNQMWLDNYAFFTALCQHNGTNRWSTWPDDIARRRKDALAHAREVMSDAIEKCRFEQYVFFKQWHALKSYCNERGVLIIGDIPMYVNYGSADVWAHQEYFKMGVDLLPRVVAGVPPDYFSATGQRWGNPLYDWNRIQESGFEWWIQRMQHTLSMYDFARIDHFRGFVASWEIPAQSQSAIDGQWVAGPGRMLFDALYRRFPHLPVIAEDLGIITPDVRELMESYEIPGMRVLLFAFGDDSQQHPYLPHNHVAGSVVYVGNHDTNTARGWFEEEASVTDRSRLARYIGKELSSECIAQELIRLSQMSISETAIVPMQDVLNLSGDSRMNRPGAEEGNWLWQMRSEQLEEGSFRLLGEMTELYGRA